MPLPVDLNKLTSSHLDALLRDGVAERRGLEYKAEYDFDRDPKAKAEFCRDISSLANTSGGDLLIGVKANKGVPTSIDGIDATDFDGYKLRLDSLLQARVRPRVNGVEYYRVDLADPNKHVVVIRVPRSYNRPHQVEPDSDRYEFWGRNTGGKYQLDVDDLRTTIRGTTDLTERVHAFRQKRVNAIRNGETPVRLRECGSGKTIIHMVPLSAFDAVGNAVDFALLPDVVRLGKLWPILGSVHLSRYNLDGFLQAQSFKDGEYNSYMQLYRNGIIETAEAEIMCGNADRKLIPHQYFEPEVDMRTREWSFDEDGLTRWLATNLGVGP